MLLSTLPRLRCPASFEERPPCAGALTLAETTKKKGKDVLFGTLVCQTCQAPYPIVAGVAILVSDVEEYFKSHVKGLASLLDDSEIPDIYLESYLQAKAEIETGHIEEDLESQRINALYFMNHYLRVGASRLNPWWRPKKDFSPEIDRLVKNYWDNGPFAKIVAWTAKYKNQHVVELACGSGGLARALAKTTDSYLGVDFAFVSIALARHMNLGAPYRLPLRIPRDLYEGPLTGRAARPKPLKGNVDFVVGEIQNLPLAEAQFSLAIALNVIDMIPDPGALPRLQASLLQPNGVAIQSSPYIWHEGVASFLRSTLPKKIKTSAEAVEFLYERAGLKIFRTLEHVPWLFLKHFRQIEMYSVHLFAARKES